jgi:hypothetical protein
MATDPRIVQIVAQTVSDARARNPRLHFTDPDEVLTLRCVGCLRTMKRPRRVVERDTAKWGFCPCSLKCRKAQLAKGERIFVARRGE